MVEGEMITVNNSRYYIDNIDSKHNEVLAAYLDRYALNCVDLVKIIVVDDVYSAILNLSDSWF